MCQFLEILLCMEAEVEERAVNGMAEILSFWFACLRLTTAHCFRPSKATASIDHRVVLVVVKDGS